LLAYYLRLRSSSPAASTAAAPPRLLARPPAAHEAWYPLLERALVLLAKLYRAIERGSFEVLAQDAVSACTRALVAAAAAVRARPPPAASDALDAYAATRLTLVAGDGMTPPLTPLTPPPGTLARGLPAAVLAVTPRPPAAAAAATTTTTSALDGDLFLIKNLLVLREQLSPFEVALTSTTKTLNFASTAEALGALVGHIPALFRLSRDNALLSFVMTGLPTVAEERVDFKAELEGMLKGACEAFIAAVARLLVGGGGGGGDFVRAWPLPLAATGAAGGPAAFIAAADGLLDALEPAFAPNLALVRRRIGLYMGSPITAAILFKPAREAVLAELQALRAHVHEALAGSGGGEGGAAEAAAAAATAARRGLDARLARLVRLVEVSDGLALDPASAAFGLDGHLLLDASASAAAELEGEAGGARGAADTRGRSAVGGAGGGGGEPDAGAAGTGLDESDLDQHVTI
jgi:hypothetical protein